MSYLSVVGLAVTAVAVVVVVKFFRREHPDSANHAGERGYPGGGEMADLNRLLQEGTISTDEYELLKRRILAGQVF